jgi:hypothetical protein
VIFEKRGLTLVGFKMELELEKTIIGSVSKNASKIHKNPDLEIG